MLNQFVVHISSWAIIILFMPYIYFIGFIWYRQTITVFTNKTTSERFGRKKANRIEDEDVEGESTTTSLLAEKAIQNIGIREEYYGCGATVRYFTDFCGGSCTAECSQTLGYQD